MHSGIARRRPSPSPNMSSYATPCCAPILKQDRLHSNARPPTFTPPKSGNTIFARSADGDQIRNQTRILPLPDTHRASISKDFHHVGYHYYRIFASSRCLCFAFRDRSPADISSIYKRAITLKSSPLSCMCCNSSFGKVLHCHRSCWTEYGEVENWTSPVLVTRSRGDCPKPSTTR